MPKLNKQIIAAAMGWRATCRTSLERDRFTGFLLQNGMAQQKNRMWRSHTNPEAEFAAKQRKWTLRNEQKFSLFGCAGQFIYSYWKYDNCYKWPDPQSSRQALY